MDFGTQPHASFIPKKPLAPNTPSAYERRNIPLFTLIALIIFIVAVGLGGGIFVYQKYLEKDLADKKVALEKARSAFEPVLIEELHRLDKRIEHAKNLLANHDALSTFFDLLEQSTLQNVQFKTLNLLSTADGGKMTINMLGAARSYASVALQSDLFNKTKGIKDPVFSQLNLDNTGSVSFAINANLDRDVFKYSNTIFSGDESDLPTVNATTTSGASTTDQ